MLAFFVQHLPILFVAVTQCDKQKVHWSQWPSLTNQTNLCHCDSVRQTILKKNIQFLCGMSQRKKKRKFVYFLKRCQKSKYAAFFGTFCPFGTFFKSLFGNFYVFWYFLLNFSNILKLFVRHIQILFVAVTQCDKQKIHLLQWLSLTNKTNLCHSNPVRQTILKKISNCFVAYDKGI